MDFTPTSYAAANSPRTADRRLSVLGNADRLAALRATGLLDSDVEEAFDRLSRLAVRLLNIPAAFISLVDENRDFYKSACGFGEPLASTRELAGITFCHYTVQDTTPLVIPDTAADPLYRDVPTVTTLGVAAYVGIPIVIEGQVIGAFCAIDMKPHPWTAHEVEVLQELSASARREIELRSAIARTEAALAIVREQHESARRANELLQEQALELELQSEELQATTAHLEERTEEAEAANVAKSEFLSMMSHELRTPLNAIGGYAELLAMGVHGPVTPAQDDFLRRIQRAGRHLQTLIADILEFARLDAGRTQFNVAAVDVQGVLKEAGELLAPQVDEAGLTLSLADCEDEAAPHTMVLADATRLKQILLNLLGNAIKFTPRGGRLTVSCSSTQGQVRLDVTDTGRGIPPSEIERVFEPFVQVDRSLTPSTHQGVGLGLSICRKLARGMGGNLTATSAPGEGSTFTLTLAAASS